MARSVGCGALWVVAGGFLWGVSSLVSTGSFRMAYASALEAAVFVFMFLLVVDGISAMLGSAPDKHLHQHDIEVILPKEIDLGGDISWVSPTRGVVEPRYTISHLHVNGVDVLPHFAHRVSELREGFSRRTLLRVDCNGVTVPRNPDTEVWLQQLQELFLRLDWAERRGNHTLLLEQGERVMEQIANRGSTALQEAIGLEIGEYVAARTPPALSSSPNGE